MKSLTWSTAKLLKLTLATIIMVATFSTAGCDLKIKGGSLDYTIDTDKSDVSLGVAGSIIFGSASQDNLEADPQIAAPAQAASPPVQPILDLIGRTEGTDRGDGYDETLGYGAFTGGDVILTAMTLVEIETLQTAMLRHPKNRFKSSAIGRYQITRTTLRMLKTQLGLAEDALFTATLQDALAVELLKRRGYDDWLTGEIDDRQFALNLAKEWASLPNPTNGKGYYPGQNAAVGYATVKEVLEISK